MEGDILNNFNSDDFRIIDEDRITYDKLKTLFNISTGLCTVKTYNDIGEIIFDNLKKFKYIAESGGKLAVYNAEEDLYKEVFHQHHVPPPFRLEEPCKLKDVKYFSGIAIKQKKTLLINDSHSDYALSIDGRLKNVPGQSMVFIPLIYNDILIGLFSYARYPENSIDKEFAEFLESICRFVSIKIAEMQGKIKRQKYEKELNKYREKFKQLNNITYIENLHNERSGGHIFEGMVSINPEMKKIFNLISVIAKTDNPVLIEGETGTGKELIAKAIQNLSNRKDKPFVIVNCANISKDIFESELFGYVKGAFTGAINDSEGLFSSADGGTIFLDEIGELPKDMQPKLLRFLQFGEYRPVGSKQSRNVNVRILTSTNRDLKEYVTSGLFRSDLFYRINVTSINIPPLRERKEDIPFLVEYFIRKFNEKYKKNIKTICSKSLNLLEKHDFDGNIRELENIIENAIINCPERVIKIEHLPNNISKKYLETRSNSPLSKKKRAKEERMNILENIIKNNWNVTKTSKELNIARRTLYYKMRKYNIKNPKKDVGK